MKQFVDDYAFNYVGNKSLPMMTTVTFGKRYEDTNVDSWGGLKNLNNKAFLNSNFVSSTRLASFHSNYVTNVDFLRKNRLGNFFFKFSLFILKITLKTKKLRSVTA